MKVLLTISLVFAAQILLAQSNVIDSLERIVALHQRDTVELNALLDLSNEFLRKNLEKASSYAHQAVTLAKATKKDSRLANGYQYLITLSQSSGQLDSAHYYLGLLEGLLKENPSSSKIKISYNQSAGLFYKNQGQFSKALPYMIDNLSMLPNENESRAGQLLNIGNTYNNMGDYKNAMTYHLQALKLFEKLKSKRGQSFCLQSLGNDFFELGEYSVAKKYLFQSEKLKEELGDRRGVLTSWMTLGAVYQQTNKPEISMQNFSKALVRARELKLSIEESQVLFNMGSLLKTTKKTDEAREAFSEALLLARQSGDSALVSRIKTYLISMQTDIEKEKEEEQTLLENIEISLEKGALTNTAEGHFELAKWYESRKQFEKAYENLKKGQLLNDSLKGNEVVLHLKSLEEEYKSDKKEQEIALLKKDQELQALALSKQRANIILISVALVSVIVTSLLLVNRYRVMSRSRRLMEMERMRNTIARDLHDDIGSTLSSINIMSQLALKENGNAGTHLKKIANHSAGMMEKMSDIVWSINPKNDSLEQVVIKMKEFAAEILEPKNIDYSFNIEDNILAVKLDVEKRKNIFLIFKEAVNNAAKYSEGNKLTVSLLMQQDTLHLSVEDNGKGFEPALATRGNGLKNMEDRAHSMNGKMMQVSQSGVGTNIHLEVPLT